MSNDHSAHPASDTPADFANLGMRAARRLAGLMESEQPSMPDAVPRLEMFVQAFERISLAVQRSIALAHRRETGWPRAGRSERRAAKVRPEVKRSVARIIPRSSESEMDELLADVQLLDRSEEEVVRLIRLDLELAAEDLRTIGGEAVTLADELDAGRRHPRTGKIPLRTESGTALLPPEAAGLCPAPGRGQSSP